MRFVFACAQFSLQETLGGCRNYTQLKWAAYKYTKPTPTHPSIIHYLPQFTSCVALCSTASGATTFHPISGKPESITCQLPTSCNPSNTHFHKQTPGLSQSKVKYLLSYLFIFQLSNKCKLPFIRFSSF